MNEKEREHKNVVFNAIIAPIPSYYWMYIRLENNHGKKKETEVQQHKQNFRVPSWNK